MCVLDKYLLSSYYVPVKEDIYDGVKLAEK